MPMPLLHSLVKRKLVRTVMGALVLCFVLLGGCTSSQTAMSEKIDSPLRHQLEKAEASAPISTLSVFVRCIRPITDEDVQKMRATGSIIGSVAGDICTARGLPRQIRELARLDFVVTLELETQNNPSINP